QHRNGCREHDEERGGDDRSRRGREDCRWGGTCRGASDPEGGDEDEDERADERAEGDRRRPERAEARAADRLVEAESARNDEAEGGEGADGEPPCDEWERWPREPESHRQQQFDQWQADGKSAVEAP